MDHFLTWQTGQEIPCVLWNLKVNFLVHKSPSLVAILSLMNPIHTLKLFSLRSILMLSFHLLLKVFQVVSFLHIFWVNFICIFHLCCSCYMPCPFHQPWFLHCNNIYWLIQIMKFPIMKFFHYPVTSPLLAPNILLITHFLNTIILCSSLHVRDQASLSTNER
jgi:hypothetical protein